MAKINGFFETFLDNELYAKLHGRSNVIRVYCMVRFKTNDGFSEPYPAIIDTGAHTSVLPLKIWKSADYNILNSHYIKGLVPDAVLHVKVGEAAAVLADLLNVTKEYKFLCFFSPNDNTPLILGFKEMLSNFRMLIDYKHNIVSLEENN